MNKRVLLWRLQVRVLMRTRVLGLLVSIKLRFWLQKAVA